MKMTLDKLPIGKEAIIEKVGGEGDLRLRFLDMGIIPHTKVKMQKIAPMGDPVEILIRGYELTLRKDDASKITITTEVK
jgi:ferrous iron transport protein A